MVRRVAFVLCAALCVALAPAAHADVTYTWETLSSSGGPGNFTENDPLDFSFTVSGPVETGGDSSFAGFPGTGMPFPFPPTLVSFNLSVDGLLFITKSSFTSTVGNSDFPDWTLNLNAHPAEKTADVSLFFVDVPDTEDLFAGGFGGAASFETGVVTSVYFLSDDGFQTDNPAIYTGMLVATGSVPLPEPPSLWILIAGVAMLGLVRTAASS